MAILAQINPSVIDPCAMLQVLEETIAGIKKGEIVGIGVVAQFRDGCAQASTATTHLGNHNILLGGAARLTHILLNMQGVEIPK